MSLNSLSNTALYRIRPVSPAADTPRGLESGQPGSHETMSSDPQRFFDDFTRFIPTEMLAPYISLLTISAHKGWDAGKIYLAFIIATPIVFWFIHLVKIASNPAWPWPSLREIPRLLWLSLATTIAFAVWGLAPPTNPFQERLGGLEVIGLAATMVSLVLTGFDIIVTRLATDAQVPRKRAVTAPISLPSLSPTAAQVTHSKPHAG